MTVRIDPATCRAFGLRPVEPVGIVVQLDGTALWIGPGGEVDRVLPGGHPRPGVGADPGAGRLAP